MRKVRKQLYKKFKMDKKGWNFFEIQGLGLTNKNLGFWFYSSFSFFKIISLLFCFVSYFFHQKTDKRLWCAFGETEIRKGQRHGASIYWRNFSGRYSSQFATILLASRPWRCWQLQCMGTETGAKEDCDVRIEVYENLQLCGGVNRFRRLLCLSGGHINNNSWTN